MNKLDWAYLAGFLDGEGSITLRLNPKKDNVSMRVEISNTDEGVMLWIQSQLGGHLVVQDKPPYKKVWKWVASGRESCQRILYGCYPYMRVKRPQAEVIRAVLARIEPRTSDPRAAQYFKAMMDDLNKKGGPK